MQREYKTLSARAKILLNREEGYDVEFKRSVGELNAHDLVAFANSVSGGTLLIGIEEIKSDKGRKKGIIHGCPVGDRERLSIINRAESCVPPIDIEIFIENSSKKSFFRIEIPSGNQKPYCTANGTYKVRGDGRTNSLLPSRLLSMFLDRESSEFIHRFKIATDDLERRLFQVQNTTLMLTNNLEDSLLEMKSKIIDEMNSLLSLLESMEHRIDYSLSDIFERASSAEANSDEAMGLTDEILGHIQLLSSKIEEFDQYQLPNLEVKLDELLNHFEIEDPIIKTARVEVENLTESFYNDGIHNRDKLIDAVTEHCRIGGIRASWVEVAGWVSNKLKELEHS